VENLLQIDRKLPIGANQIMKRDADKKIAVWEDATKSFRHFDSSRGTKSAGW